MSKLFVGPFTVIAKAGKKAYKLEIPNSMRVSATQNIDNLYRLDPRVHFPPAFENSAPDEPQARITDSQLIITALSYETFEDETSEVFADTALGKFKLHELCIRTHCSECVDAIAKFSDTIRHWPFFLGRFFTLPGSILVLSVGMILTVRHKPFSWILLIRGIRIGKIAKPSR